jgi:GcrA cell cycle regulator
MWTREQEDKLRELWAQGLSASQIAPLIPAGSKPKGGEPKPVTRDMVIGKARRMGLESRPSPIIREGVSA